MRVFWSDGLCFSLWTLTSNRTGVFAFDQGWFPFPAIPGNTTLKFPFPSHWKIPFPFPKSGNAIFNFQAFFTVLFKQFQIRSVQNILYTSYVKLTHGIHDNFHYFIHRVLCSRKRCPNLTSEKYSLLKNIHSRKIFTLEKDSLKKNIHPKKYSPQTYSLLKIFSPEKYSPLKNIQP